MKQEQIKLFHTGFLKLMNIEPSFEIFPVATNLSLQLDIKECRSPNSFLSYGGAPAHGRRVSGAP